MLSSVANYLFGASTVEEAETENGDALSKTQNLVSGETKTDNECDLLTSPADLDWELVDRVVHNYGHGSNGIALSWGTSVYATRLVRDLVQKLTLKSHL